MLARAQSGTVIGIEAHEVSVEAKTKAGLPQTVLIGLAKGAARESLVRVRAAIATTDVSFPMDHLIINLLPADLPKTDSTLDLALALAFLVTKEKLTQAMLEGRRFYGELSLGGVLEPVRGAVLLADLARRAGDRELVVPSFNAAEAAIIPGIRVIGPRTLGELLGHLNGTAPLPAAEPMALERPGRHSCISDVRGQVEAKRALLVAAAGGHNLLMVGPPGSGKTMLARCLPGLLPSLEANERVEVTRIYSAAGKLAGRGLVSGRPFRAPHHTASQPALCGGGSHPRPGEITLAHRGVLFLDELPEFSRQALESLREPLEERRIHIARAASSLAFPADVVLVAAMNPCPCGRYRGDVPGRPLSAGPPCLCHFDQVQRYRGRVSGPLLDRIDLHVVVDALPFRELARRGGGPTSAELRLRVEAARDRQRARLGPARCNATMDPAEVRQIVPLDEASLACVEQAADRYGLSARAVTRILKVARSIADLDDLDRVTAAHLEEAIGLRVLDREREAAGAAPLRVFAGG